METIRVRSRRSKAKKEEQRFAYCFSCQEARSVTDGEVVLLANGKKMLKGTCSRCGSKVAGMMARETPHDRVQTKQEAKENRKGREIEKGRRLIRLRKRYDGSRN